MDYKLACEVLEINIDKNISIEYLKKQYHKMALQNHPDKCNNTIDSKEKFQQINEAYNYLLREISIINNDTTNDTENSTNSSYLNILNLFLESLLKGKLNKLNEYVEYGVFISSIIKDIVHGYKDVTIKMFDNLDKDKILIIYNFLFKYKKILYITDEILEKIKQIIVDKYKDIQIYILNPSIDDLFKNNVFKLELNNALYFVPLWHNELYFDNNIIVKCVPELPNNITIDENNNIHITLQISFTFSLLIQNSISFFVGEKELTISLNELQMKMNQIHILKGQGISKIYENDIYNIEEKSDLIIKLIFIEPNAI